MNKKRHSGDLKPYYYNEGSSDEKCLETPSKTNKEVFLPEIDNITELETATGKNQRVIARNRKPDNRQEDYVASF